MRRPGLIAALLLTVGVRGLPAQSTAPTEAQIANLRTRAAKGDAESQNRLGELCRDGSGLTKDDRAAAAWFLKAADQGNARAQFNLGVCYANGSVVQRDQRAAVEWYRKAADQGDAD